MDRRSDTEIEMLEATKSAVGTKAAALAGRLAEIAAAALRAATLAPAPVPVRVRVRRAHPCG